MPNRSYQVAFWLGIRGRSGFPEFDKLKFAALLRGVCWLIVDGQDEPVRAEAGDVFLLSGQRSFVLASDLETVPIEAATVFSPHVSKVVKLNNGEDFFQIGGFVRLDSECGGFLADVLPQLIHIRAASPQAGILQWLLGQLVREQESEHPGASLVSSQLAQLIFVHVLRAHLEQAGAMAAGWLRALGDKRIAPALRLMHGDPARETGNWRSLPGQRRCRGRPSLSISRRQQVLRRSRTWPTGACDSRKKRCEKKTYRLPL